MVTDYARILVNHDDLFGAQFTFVSAAWAHCKAQRFTTNNGTQVAAGPQQPAAQVKAAGDCSQPGRNLVEAVRPIRHSKRKMQPNVQRAQVARADVVRAPP